MIFDGHMHVDDVPSLGWKMDPALCIQSMDDAGVDKAIIMTITDMPQMNVRALDLIAEACSAYPGRLFGFARMHPGYGAEAVDWLEHAITELGFKGLKLHPVSTLAHPSSTLRPHYSTAVMSR